MLRNVELGTQADALAIERARVRVGAALGDSSSVDEGRIPNLDFETGEFRSAPEDRNRFGGTFQVVFRRGSEGLFRWGFDEPDLPKALTREVRSLVRGDAALFELSLNSPLPSMESELAHRLAGWIAVRGGYTGALAVPTDRGLAFLAIQIAPRDGRAGDGWCFSCGGAGPFFARDGVALCRACTGDLRALGEPHPFDPRRVVFEGTLRTPMDVLTLRAAFGSAPNLSLTAPGIDDAGGEAARQLCLFCGASRGEVVVLNDAFAVCPSCADACANAFESS